MSLYILGAEIEEGGGVSKSPPDLIRFEFGLDLLRLGDFRELSYSVLCLLKIQLFIDKIRFFCGKD